MYSHHVMTENMAGQTKRTPLADPDATERPVFVLADRHKRIHTPWHSHRRIQFIHVSEGVLTVLTRRSRFVIPPQRAVWIGPGVEHRILSPSPFWLTTCYLEPDILPRPMGEGAVAVDRLTDELLIAASSFGGSYPEGGSEARLIGVLCDRLQILRPIEVVLPEPADPRLRRITERLLANPALDASLGELASGAALTERTAARLFVSDTGMTFGRWRQHMRLQVALGHLAAGASVTETAFAVGYSDVSSFIIAFRQLFGATPARILSAEPNSSPEDMR